MQIHVIIQNFTFRIALLLISKITIILGPVHMIPGQLIAPGQLTDPGVNFTFGAWSDVCNCSHEFFIALGQLREAGYPLYNTG